MVEKNKTDHFARRQWRIRQISLSALVVLELLMKLTSPGLDSCRRSDVSTPRRQAGRQVKVLAASPTTRRRSVPFREAAAQLAQIAKECHRLALKTGDQNLMAEAKASFTMSRSMGQSEADR